MGGPGGDGHDTKEEDAMNAEPRVASVPAPPVVGARVLRASELLGAQRLIQIEHGGAIYTLRITKNDRLILTK
jgi:hemin uptake protein HemP